MENKRSRMENPSHMCSLTFHDIVFDMLDCVCGTTVVEPEFTLTCPLFSVSGYAVLWFQIDGILNNINASNNTFQVLEGGILYTATIANGMYTPSALASVLVTAMNDATPGNTYNVTFNTSTGRFTFTRTSGIAAFALRFGTSNSAHKALSFPSTYNDGPGSGPFTSTLMPVLDPLMPYQNLKLCSNTEGPYILDSHLESSGTTSDVFHTIYRMVELRGSATSFSSSIATQVEPFIDRKAMRRHDIYDIKFKLTSNRGDTLALDNENHSWRVAVRFFHD